MIVSGFVAALCVAAMGFAIQRGGTCSVAAVEEWLATRRAQRMMAMLEASLWVAGGLALARLAHLAGSMPASYEAGRWAVAGGALLGVGAWVNRACVFGAVARLGSGEWAYVATPLGFFLGSLSVGAIFHRPSAIAVPATPALPAQAMPIVGLAFLAFAIWRLRPAFAALRRFDRAAWRLGTVWTPHAATVVIGVSFVLTLLLAGRWAYTDVLADLAQAMRASVPELALPALLLAVLYAGALAGGLTAGRWRATPPSAAQCLRCLAGGVLMAWGSLLIPGSNDGLVLIGVPLLQPHAWLALASMFGAIAAAMGAQRMDAARWRAALDVVWPARR